MDYSNSNRTPAELKETASRLRAERAIATPLELDRIKLQAIRQAERSRSSFYARRKGTLMKSRLALALVVAAGFMLSTTGATLAITGSSGSGSAAENQYVQPASSEGGESGHKGVNAKSLQGNNSEPQPVADNQTQVVSTTSSGSLPFTGFLALPLLVIGVGLLTVGAIMRKKSKALGDLS